ncbi:uncharacterized protein LOC113133723 [Xyrichtys novacula]|uniref:Uncharacterized protein LOC113133723 n=1 Tax=Xyrichtys novacula TaxID=13765 RepID=A0AAV1EQ71_XYRNO|nr:uncharacterized protein LOC113133723 [Xyrichtys novacula]
MVLALDLDLSADDDNAVPLTGEEVEGPLDSEQEEMGVKDDKGESNLNLEFQRSPESSPRCSTLNHERHLSSSYPVQSTSWPLPSIPVPGSHSSSSSPLHQLPANSQHVSIITSTDERHLSPTGRPGKDAPEGGKMLSQKTVEEDQ